ncbi:Hypothetical predicted protein [Octopus vulgaris]|uniref:Uncharacterized protein n=1 Tax=Octopus vulgaris TaxID=6645 RepID=A0AA36AK81_OCTVU|nr:Hypothetical predicted protein [Octopus vulgaris]
MTVTLEEIRALEQGISEMLLVEGIKASLGIIHCDDIKTSVECLLNIDNGVVTMHSIGVVSDKDKTFAFAVIHVIDVAAATAAAADVSIVLGLAVILVIVDDVVIVGAILLRSGWRI